MDKRRFPISAVLILVLFFALTTITVGLGVLNFRHARQSQTHDLHASLQRIAARLQITLVSPLYDLDMQEIRSIVQSEMDDKNLYALEIIEIIEIGERIVFSAVRDDQWQVVEKPIRKPLDALRHLTLSEKLVLKDGSENYFRVVITDRFLQKALRRLMHETVMTVVAINLLVVAILFVCLRLIIIKPIGELRRYANDVDSGNLVPQQPRALFFGELAELNGAVQVMVGNLRAFIEQLENLDKLKDEFLANTSHELRTPLTGIIGIAESLRDGIAGSPSEAMQSNLSVIIGSGKRLSGLVDDILDFSKLKTATLDLKVKPVSIHVIADIVLTLSRPLTEAKALTLNNDVDTDLPFVHADENRVQQILYNLVGNAVKFTEQGEVSVSARVEGDMLEISVADTGIGIAPDKLDRIFIAFEQADGSIARRYGGTGIGLSITKQLVELHGGSLSVDSREREGSIFRFTLPISKAAATVIDSASLITASAVARHSIAEEAMGVDSTADAPETAALPRRRILVVDDEVVNQQVLKNVLSLDRYDVYQAFSGKEALAAVKDSPPFDLVLLDVMMPLMSGYEVCEQIRQHLPSNELPIIMLSAKNQIEDLVTGLRAGANDYLTKPISKEELLARLKTHLDLKTLIAENARMGAELDVARRLQQMVLPRSDEIASIDGLDIACHMQPADEVGGDYYDILPFEGGVKIGIGDVTGHGLESGVLMLMAQTAIRTLLTHNESDQKHFLSILNRTIYENIRRMQMDRMMTLSLLDYRNGRVRISGQHEEVILVRRGGTVERLETTDLGAYIGIIPDIDDTIAEKDVHLDSGDGFVLYTDGIIEARPEGADPTMANLYGLDRLCRVAKCHWHLSADEIRQSIIDDVYRHGGREEKFDDDLTLVVVKQK